MDNIGDWLYIVLLIVAGVSSMFKSKKKESVEHRANNPRPANKKEEPHEEEAAPAKDFWEILEEMTGEQPASKPQPIAEQPAPQRPNQAPAPVPAATRQPPKPTVQETDAPSISLNDLDELKRAVVWSEILQRKL